MGVFHVFLDITNSTNSSKASQKCSLESLELHQTKPISRISFNIFETSYSFFEFETCVGISLSTALKLTKKKILVYVTSQTY